MKLISWNVNGLRAAQKNGFLKWFEDEQADVFSVQEVKAFPEQLDLFVRQPKGYETFFCPAEKPGYSGVGVFVKKSKKTAGFEVIEKMGVPEIDAEGRFIRVDFKNFTLINTYFPNSQREHTRLDYKLFFCSELHKYLKKLAKQGKNIVLCGDYNIAHQEIDLANPKSNRENAGFLPEERDWMTKFLSSGYTDIFRKLNPSPHQYTWWSYRPGVREKNIGWRLDYHCINSEFSDRIVHAYHEPEVRGSDHCPVGLVIKD